MPPTLRVLAPGYLSARQLLQLRVVQGSLIPTLVASYRYQCYLNADHLAARGLFTWLLDSACGPRYMDAFEAAWLMGFSSSLKLPDSSASAMNCIGNCVAPSQALQVVSSCLQKLTFICTRSVRSKTLRKTFLKFCCFNKTLRLMFCVFSLCLLCT